MNVRDTCMKTIFKHFCIFLSLTSLVGCSSVEGVKDTVKELRSPTITYSGVPYEDTRLSTYILFKSKMKEFSYRLSEVLAKREFEDGKNFAISPLSIELCLGLAIRSASGRTRQELLDALDVDFETFNASYSIFYRELNRQMFSNTDDLNSELLLTNSIWIDDDYTLKEDCLDALENDYYCYSYHVDFDEHNSDANKAIREFNKEKTKGLIDQDLKLSPQTLFVLMNTLYLKDIWNEGGHDLSYANNTYRFKNSNGSYSNKLLLSGYYLDGHAIENEDFSSFFTSTENGYAITFIKPNEGKNIKDIFTKENIDYACNTKYVYEDDEKYERYHTKCIFPEYRANSDIDLIEAFQEDFNVKSIFSSSCEMKNITDGDVFCSGFNHIAKLKVDKTGIEGAAVTYMSYATQAGPNPSYTDVYEEFVVDKEFGFILSRNQHVIFSGIVTNID